MQFNTALCFFLTGFSMLLAFNNKKYLSYVALFPSLFISWVTVLEYLFNLRNGIDQIFVTNSITSIISTPGRMAPDAALCFIFLGIATIILINRPKATWVTFISTLLFSASVIPGCYGLLGYFVKMYAYRGWGAYSRMAPMTAVCFLFVGLAGLLFLYQLILAHEKSRILRPAIWLQLIIIACAGFVTHVVLQYQVEQFNSYNQEVSDHMAEQLKRGLKERSNSLKRMAKRAMLEINRHQSSFEWQQDAKEYLQDFPDINSIIILDKNQKILASITQPHLDKFMLTEDLVNHLQIAISNTQIKKMGLNTPLYQSQNGETIFSSVHPLFEHGQFIGLIIGNINVNKFLLGTLNFKHHSLTLEENGKTCFSNFNQRFAPILRNWEVVQTIRDHGLNWSLHIIPYLETFRQHSNLLPMVVYLIGICFALLLSIIGHQALVATDQNQITQKLNEQLNDGHRFLNTVIDALPVTLFCKDAEKDYRFTMWNRYCEELLGIKAEEVIGKTDYDFFPKEQADFFRQKDLETMNQKNIIDIPEEKIKTNDKGELLLHTMKVPVYDSHGNPKFLLGISEDITQKFSDKKLLEEQRVKLLHAEKMTSLGEVAGGIAHEINNPLAIIQGRVEQLKRYAENDMLDKERVINTTEAVINTIKRVTKIIRGLRNFARDAENDDFQSASISEIIFETVEFCKTRFSNHGVDLQLNEIDPNLLVHCRSVQISQVILNLLNNAFDAIEKTDNPFVKIEVEANQQTVSIRIIDSGPGITKEVAEKIMLPFFTTKEVGKGTGLGLSISSAIIQTHKGKLYVDHSMPNTTFVIELPKA